MLISKKKKRSCRIILSLGSNMGERMSNLQKAVDLIFERMGSIKTISSVYESPAMGFSGDAFFNVVLEAETGLLPEVVLEEILEIERKMGRIRSSTGGYISRPIDIDILFVEDLVIQEENLIVPHPRLQDRKFVLEPLMEIAPDFRHPLLEKTIKELFLITKDDSLLIKQKEKPENPVNKIDFKKFDYLVIEGNIGAGKSSLSRMLAEDFNAKLLLERFEDNSFLPKFYEDPQRYAFPLEMSFLADRYQQMLEDLTQLDLFERRTISDYDISKSLIFAGITLQEEEFFVYRTIFNLMRRNLPNPDLYVYLFQHTDRLLENIKKRGRGYEQSISADYLEKLNKAYRNYIHTLPPEKVKILDVSDLDFVDKREDYLKVLSWIYS